jgi:PAS domain S-box-containing protein
MVLKTASTPVVSGQLGAILMNLAIDFVNIPPKELEREIQRALRITGEYTDVDRSYTFIYDFDRHTCSNTHEWCREGIEPMIEHLQETPLKGLEDFTTPHLRGETVHVPWVEDLPVGSALRNVLEPQGIKTMVAVPMIYDSQCLGFVGFDAVTHRKEWSTVELAMLRMLAEIFTNAEVGKRRVEEVETARSSAELSERLLRRAIEASKAAIWELDATNEWLDFHSGWSGLFGEQPDKLRIPLAEFQARIHPEDLDRVWEEAGSHSESSDKAVQINFRVRHRDSRWIPVLAQGLSERDPEGRLVRISGSIVDVTETLAENEKARRRLEMNSKLLLVSSRFVDVESFAPAVHAALREVGTFCSACRVTLYIVNKSSGRFEFSHEWSKASVSGSEPAPLALGPEAVHMLEEGGVVSSPDLLRANPSRTGPSLPNCSSAPSSIGVPLLAGGRLEGVIVLECTKITHAWPTEDVVMIRGFAEVIAGALARTRAESALRASEHLHRTILSTLDEAVFMTDESGVITYVNHAWRSVTGIADDQSLGRRISDLLNDCDRSAEEKKLTALLSGEPVTKYVIQLSANRDRWLSLRRLPLTAASGEVKGTIGTIMDVSDQRVLEEHLISSKIKAEAANDAKSLYLSNLSHELRTPMHGVIGMLELILARKLPEEQLLARASDARSSALALLRLLDDILDVAKGERGLIQLEEKPVNLNSVLEGVAATFAAEAAKKSLEFSCSVDPLLPSILLTDELRFRQIVGNLLKNAIAYTDSGSISVKLFNFPQREKVEVGAARHLVRLEVTDTGIGIRPDKIQDIFKPFVQLTESDHKRGGSGLGLAIVAEIVNLMGGKIDIQSVLGSGTAVFVDLPLVAAPRKALSEAFAGNGGDVAECLKGMHVLVAEDNEINRIVAIEHLEQLGCLVRTAENGREAVRACETEHFDIVLMDCLMPEMDGFDASRAILGRARSRYPAIIGCTANASEKTAALCKAAGMRSVISKPYTRIHLFHELDRFRTDATTSGPVCSSPPLLSSGPEQPVLISSLLESYDCNLGVERRFSLELLAIFRKDAPIQVAAVHDAIASGDPDRIQAAAHKLKGGSAAVGLRRLEELCRRISDFEPTSVKLTANDKTLLIAFGARLDIELADAIAALAEFESSHSDLGDLVTTL